MLHGLQGQLTEGVDVVDYLMEQPNVVPRLNPRILSTQRHYLDFTANPGNMSCQFKFYFPIIVLRSILDFTFFLLIFAVVDEWEDATMFSYLDMRDKTAVLTRRMKYFTNNGKQP